MVKKVTKNIGMEDMFVKQAIEEKTAAFKAASEKIQREIDSLEKSLEEGDSDLSSVEDRNELNYLKSKLRHLEADFYADITNLKTQNR